jgi:carboxypeptidase Q
MKTQSLSLLLLGCACASTRPTVSEVAPVSAYGLARDLSERVGARPTGSEGDTKSQQWAIETMQRLGFVNVRREVLATSTWLRGQESVEWLGVGPLKATALGRSGETPVSGVEGDVVMVGSVKEAAALPAERIKGKVLFVFSDTERTKDGSGYSRGVEPRRLGAETAERLGAIGVVIRSVSTAFDENPHTGAARPSAVPAFALAPKDAERLAAAMRWGSVRLRLISRPTVKTVETANVMGEVTGAQRPNEIVLLGAHLDSWDLATGALDDASGVGVVLDVARRLKAQGVQRTVRVVLFANEESGLAGAEAYAKAHGDELHVLALESDSGCGDVYGVEFNADARIEPLFRQWLAPLIAKGVTLSQKSIIGGADLIPLAAKGVPVVQFEQDRSSYFDIHHSARDTVAALDDAGLSRLVDAFMLLVGPAANSSETFGRSVPGRE